mgnify:CR=1 FL=1
MPQAATTPAEQLAGYSAAAKAMGKQLASARKAFIDLQSDVTTEDIGLAVREGLFTSIRRQGIDDELHYGELVALSGDFYESPEELFAETPARLPWLWPEHDAQRLREIFARELGWTPSHNFESGLRSTVEWYVTNRDWCRGVQEGRYDRERLGKI